MKASLKTLERGFNKVVGEGRSYSRQIGVTTAILRIVAVAGAAIYNEVVCGIIL